MTSEKAAPSIFMTELDCILDTRMGTILRINPNAVEEVITGGYFDRTKDVFNGIDKTQFADLYKARDKRTIQASMITPIISYARDFCMQTYKGNIETPFIREPRIRINLYPYQLTQEEKDLVLSAIRLKVGKMPAIESVYMTYEQITPNYLKQDVSMIALYDPYEWLEVHSASERFKKESCPSVMMLGPLVLKNLEETGNKIDELRCAIELLAKPFVDLNLLVPKVFSADVVRVHNRTVKETKQESVG